MELDEVWVRFACVGMVNKGGSVSDTEEIARAADVAAYKKRFVVKVDAPPTERDSIRANLEAARDAEKNRGDHLEIEVRKLRQRLAKLGDDDV
jgi:hypothetical protein